MIIKKISLIFVFLPFVGLSNYAQKIYEWRNGRTGIYPDKNLLKSWPELGPQTVWEYSGIGNGYGSPVFTPDRNSFLKTGRLSLRLNSQKYNTFFNNFGCT